MPNLQQRGAAWLGSQLQTAAGQASTYRRRGSGGVEEFAIVGTWSEKVYDQVDQDGEVQQVLAYDWILVAADLDEISVSPRPGDQLVGTVAGSAVTFEIRPIGNLPAVEWADTSGILIRLHTKRVG